MDTSSVSGYLEDGFEDLSSNFTQLETVARHGVNTLTRAKRHGRWYLLKSLNEQSQGKLVYQEMLRKELDIMMRLQHPCIVQAVNMEQVGELGECIVMEWIEGMNLKQWLETSTTSSQRIHVANQLFDAVAYIHSLDIVHRDLKPSNIMVTANGKNVKLIDFGLADTDVHAILKQPAGTQQYMAPEQASSSHPDVRNDIYSLGLVLRKMNLPRDYRKVASRCILPIDERYQSVEDIKNDLAHRRTMRKTMRIGGAALLLAGMLVGTAIVSSRQNRDTRYITDTHAREQVDSLKQELGQATGQMALSQLAQDSLRSHLGSLNDTIATLNASNAQLRQVQKAIDERERLVSEAIAEGLRIIDTTNAATHLKEHVDTVRNADYVWIDWHFQATRGESKIPEYMNKIRNEFTSKELAEIEYALKEHCNNYEEQIKYKLSKIKGFVFVVD